MTSSLFLKKKLKLWILSTWLKKLTTLVITFVAHVPLDIILYFNINANILLFF